MPTNPGIKGSDADTNDRNRQAILANIRTSLGRQRGMAGAGAAAASYVEIFSPEDLRKNLERHAPAPSLSRLDNATTPEQRLALFARMAEAVAVQITYIGSEAEIPKSIADFLIGQDGAQKMPISVAAAPSLRHLDWASEPRLKTEFGAIRDGAAVALQQAFAGIAETGSLMVCSSPDHPVTLNFLGDLSLVILHESDLVLSLESAWQKWRNRPNQAASSDKQAASSDKQAASSDKQAASSDKQARDPRLINIITGPSRTADIEGKILLGAHGPGTLHIILVADKFGR